MWGMVGKAGGSGGSRGKGGLVCGKEGIRGWRAAGLSGVSLNLSVHFASSSEAVVTRQVHTFRPPSSTHVSVADFLANWCVSSTIFYRTPSLLVSPMAGGLLQLVDNIHDVDRLAHRSMFEVLISLVRPLQAFSPLRLTSFADRPMGA